MNGAAIGTIALLLFLFGISIRANWQLDQLLGRFGNQVEVAVFLQPGVAAHRLAPTVADLADVAAVETIGKDQAWEALQQDLGLPDLTEISQQLNGNPLVDELRVKATTPDRLETLAERLKNVKGVEAVRYQTDMVQQLRQLQRGLTSIGRLIVGALLITTIAVVYTTIRLILIARRPEVEIMQLVGATRTWICFPFILQGVGFGVTGGTLAWTAFMILQRLIQGLVAQQPEFIQFLLASSSLAPGEPLAIFSILLLLGSSVGFLGSILAVWELVVSLEAQ